MKVCHSSLISPLCLLIFHSHFAFSILLGKYVCYFTLKNSNRKQFCLQYSFAYFFLISLSGASLQPVAAQQLIFGEVLEVFLSANCIDCKTPVLFVLLDSPPRANLVDNKNNTGNNGFLMLLLAFFTQLDLLILFANQTLLIDNLANNRYNNCC